MVSRTCVLLAAVSFFFAIAAPLAWAQEVSDEDQALGFFKNGGAWSVRLLPNSDADKQLQWTILILTGPKVRYETTLGSFQLPGVFKSIKDMEAPLKIASIFDSPKRRASFIKRFAEMLAKGEVEAYIVVTTPLAENAKVPTGKASNIAPKALVELLGYGNPEAERQ